MYFNHESGYPESRVPGPRPRTPVNQRNRRQELRRLAMPAGLLVREGEADEARFAPGPPHEQDPDRQLAHPAGRHRDAGIAGDRCRRRAAAGDVIAIHQIRRPGRSQRRHDDRIQSCIVITASMPSSRASRRHSVAAARYSGDVSGPLALGADEQLLPEVAASRARAPVR